MLDNGALVENQQNFMRLLNENGAYASEQVQILNSLVLHHGDAIGRSQFDVVRSAVTTLQELTPKLFEPKSGDAFFEYMNDCGQRWILFLHTLCQRGDACIAREKEGFKPVLAFDYDMVIDGRKLERPVNYALVRIRPPEGTVTSREDGRAWVIIDPRAGHGSGAVSKASPRLGLH